MQSRTLIRQTLGSMALPGACILAMAYFGHHALFDDHGLRRLLGLNEELADRQAALETETTKRSVLQAKVDGLNAPNIDPDLLDERARETLGLARPDEIIIYKLK
jgi:cell division protein FtsB